MKEITKTSRLAGQLEKLYNMLNADFFNGELEPPVLTIQSTPRAYGHYTKFDQWDVKGQGRREINIGAGTLDRPIEETVATLLHEMCHQYNDTILNVNDCSRGGTYHNAMFKECALSHGLDVSRSEKSGWNRTAPSDQLIEWILNNHIQEIKLSRNEYTVPYIPGSGSVSGIQLTTTTKNNNHRYVCPCCRTIIRAFKTVNIICGECMISMIES